MKKWTGLLLISVAALILFFTGRRLLLLAYRAGYIGREWHLIKRDYHFLTHSSILGLPRFLTGTSFIAINLFLFLLALVIVIVVVRMMLRRK